MKKTLREILQQFIALRSVGVRDYAIIEKELHNTEKTIGEIQEIIREFEDEYTKEQEAQEKLRKAKKQLVIGCFIALTMASLSILSAIKILNFNNYFLLFYGGVASGILLILNFFQQHKAEKHRIKRRNFKWEQWK